MSQLVADCPRCGSKRIAFDVRSCIVTDREYEWKHFWEAFCICGACHKSTVFLIEQTDIDSPINNDPIKNLLSIQGAINQIVRVTGYVSVKDKATRPAPEYLPANVLGAFNEGAKCMAVECYNAAGTMFRLCVDMATQDKLPAEDAGGLNARIRRDLGLRLPWLFDNHVLPEALRDLSTCVREDGNDGAHRGTLTEHDAQDLLDFTEALLERIYTEPERLRLAAQRRADRRAG